MTLEPVSNPHEDKMKKVSLVVLVASAASALVAGIVAGYLTGVASTRGEKDVLKALVKHEEEAEIQAVRTIIRKRFNVSYPSNWKVDMADPDYDPDYNFSIESSGSTFVAFLLGEMETSPEDNIQSQIHAFRRIVKDPVITRFTEYGKLSGKGAILKGDILGIPHTVRFFSLFQDGLTVIIVEQCPDGDMKYVGQGLSLIETSFSLNPSADEVPERSGAD